MSTVPKNERSIYMKKFCSICLALLLCLGICGCQSETASLPPLSDDEYETVSVYGSNGNMYCEIINKIDSNTLEMEVLGSAANKWGKTVYVITDKADDWCVGDVVSVRFSKVQVPHKKSQNSFEPCAQAGPLWKEQNACRIDEIVVQHAITETDLLARNADLCILVIDQLLAALTQNRHHAPNVGVVAAIEHLGGRVNVE
jgi:hypothetical protein